jgi:hypothetical protein
LTGTGLSKSSQARIRRVKNKSFDAPPLNDTPLMSFGRVDKLQSQPWCMLEISSAHRMEKISPAIQTQGKKIFGKKPAQIFAPVTADGELKFDYIFARSTSNALVRKLLKIRGISEMATTYDADGAPVRAVSVPDADVQKLITDHKPSTKYRVRVGQFLEVLTGDAAKYHGVVIRAFAKKVWVRIDFPTGKKFIVKADHTSVRPYISFSASKHNFWGGQVKDDPALPR